MFTVSEIPIADIIPTPDNPRFLPRPEELASLTQSIKEHGVQQPLLARPHPTQAGKYDLRAGSRRLAASEAAGLDVVPVIVRDMSDELAMELTVTENLQRENLHPLEECRGVQALLDMGRTPEQVAEKLGKSPQWVARRAQLTKLSEKWRTAVLDPQKRFCRWPVAVLEQLAALSAKVQDKVFKSLSWHFDRELPSPASFAEFLSRNFTLRLKTAAFSKTDAELTSAGACATCSNRSGCQPLLFDKSEDVAPGKIGKQEMCLDAECYAAKLAAHAKALAEKAKAEHGKLVILHEYGASDAEKGIAAAVKGLGKAGQSYDYQRVKAGSEGAVPAISTGGSSAGKLVWVKQFGSSAAARSRKSESDQPTPLVERRQRLAARRKSHVIAAIRNLVDKPSDELVEYFTSHAELTMALAVVFGTHHHAAYPPRFASSEWDQVRKTEANDPARALVLEVLPVLASRLQFASASTADQYYGEACDIAKLIDADVDELTAAAKAELPEPKSWANLNADGTPKKGGGKGQATKAAKSKRTRKKKVA